MNNATPASPLSTSLTPPKYLFSLWKFNFTYILHNYDNYSMFRNVSECSGMFHVPGFIEGPLFGHVVKRTVKSGSFNMKTELMVGNNNVKWTSSELSNWVTELAQSASSWLSAYDDRLQAFLHKETLLVPFLKKPGFEVLSWKLFLTFDLVDWNVYLQTNWKSLLFNS